MSDKSARRDDWFASAALANRVRNTELSGSPMSSAWGRAWRKDDIPTSLRKLQDAVRNIVRVHGVPARCRVELAVTGHSVAAAAGFEDSPASFNRPFIWLDKRIAEECHRRRA